MRDNILCIKAPVGGGCGKKCFDSKHWTFSISAKPASPPPPFVRQQSKNKQLLLPRLHILLLAALCVLLIYMVCLIKSMKNFLSQILSHILWFPMSRLQRFFHLLLLITQRNLKEARLTSLFFLLWNPRRESEKVNYLVQFLFSSLATLESDTKTNEYICEVLAKSLKIRATKCKGF